MSPGVESRAAGSSYPAGEDQPGLQLRPFRPSDLAAVRDLLRQHTRKAQTFYAGLGYGRIASSDRMRKAL